MVISGPSGSGKTSICKRLLEDPGAVWSVSVTTRPPRAGEKHGLDYLFVSEEEFRQQVAENEITARSPRSRSKGLESR